MGPTNIQCKAINVRMAKCENLCLKMRAGRSVLFDRCICATNHFICVDLFIVAF